MTEFSIAPGTESYYDRMTLSLAIQIAREKIEEWDYAADPSGYCHERPVLVALVAAANSQAGPQ
jgi:hypothetical protein